MIKDPLVRRFISASFFAAAFVWVAVRYFYVDWDVIGVFFGFCVVFVLGSIVIGFILAPVVRLFRRKPPLLTQLEIAQLEASRDSGNKDTGDKDLP